MLTTFLSLINSVLYGALAFNSTSKKSKVLWGAGSALWLVMTVINLWLHT